MSRIEEHEFSMLGAQLQELQALLERRIEDERTTRQQTLVGLERWISERLADRDRAFEDGRRAERDRHATLNGSTPANQTLVQVANSTSAHAPEAVAGASSNGTVEHSGAKDDDSASSAVQGEIASLRERVNTLEAQISFMSARQDEFTQLLTTVREWMTSSPVPTRH